MFRGKTCKRLLSLFVVMLMVISYIPSSAFDLLRASGTGRTKLTDRAEPKGGEDGSTIEFEGKGVYSVIVAGATEQDNGDYVWTPSNTNPDHPFKFNVTYSVSGEFEYFEAHQIEIRIPLTILVDKDGNPADYFEMSLPHESDSNLDDDNVFVYRIDPDTNEIVVYNRLPCSAAQHGYFEVSYSTNKRTYDYQDYDPDGATPEDRNPSADFQATITISRDGETYSRESDPVHVYIDTMAKITKQEKAAPQKQYDGATQWQSGWGTKPADANQYYYLIWEVRSTIVATQRYDFTLVDTYDAGGELVAIKMQGQSMYVPITDPDCGKLYNQTTSYPSGRYDYILTRHLKATYDPQETYSFLNKSVGYVHPLDGVDDDTEAPAQRRWTFEHPVFVPGSGVGISFDKYGLDYNDKKVVNSESIRMFDLEPYYQSTVHNNHNRDTISNLKWYTSIAATTWNLTVEGDNKIPTNYGKKNVTVELTDNKIQIKALGPEGQPYTNYSDLLVPGEYRFDKVTFSYSLLDAYFDEASQSFKTKAVTYTDDDAITFYAQFGTEAWVEVGSYYLKTGTFTATSDGTAHNVSISGKTLTFGDNTCTGYRLVTSNKHYRTTLTAYPYVTLLRSDIVSNVVLAAYNLLHNEIAIRNTADYAIYEGDTNTPPAYRSGSKSGVDYATGIIRHSEIKKTVRYVNQPVEQNVRLTWTVSMNETYNTATGGRAYIPQESGVFYDLLPIGGTFDRSSLAVFADGRRLGDNDYSVSLQQNYNDSSRWLLTIRIFEPAKTTYSFSYATNHSWDSVSEFGNDVLNSVVYETGNVDIGDGYPDDGGPTSTSVNPDHRYLIDLDPDTNDNKFIYAKTESTLNILTAGNLGLYKQVAAAGDARYSYKTTTVSGGEYSYKIHFATDAATWARDMILVDSLENYITIDNESSEWHGMLRGFDMTVLTERGIAWKLYYSTSFTGNRVEALNITKDYVFADHTDVWTQTTDPNDPALENATAFAIDLRKTTTNADYILEPNSAISVTVFMEAPETLESESNDPIAYNNIYLLNSVKFGKDSEFADFSSNHQDYTQISFRQIADIEILKIDAEIYETTGEIVPIPGIVFRLWGTSQYNDDIDVTHTTNSQGKILFNDIPRGQYYLQEVGGVDDYLQNHVQMTVTIDQNGVVHIGEPVGESEYDWTVYDGLVIGVDPDTGLWTLGNPPRIHGDLDFDKRGSIDGPDGITVPLPNVSFAITGNSDYGTPIDIIVTSEGDGVVHIVNLEMGTYEMVEISTDDDHFLLDRVFTVKCDAAGEITIYYMDGDEIVYPLQNGMFTIVNEPYHTLKLWKYNNALPSNSVAGAKFSLTGKNYYQEATSEASGLITFNQLKSGTYTLKELVAPEGYELDPHPYTVVISEDGSATIDGLTRDEFIQKFLQKYNDTQTDTTDWDYFPIGNEPIKKTITIIKEWVGGTPDENTTPVLHLDTTKPDFNAPEATIDYEAWRTYVNEVTIPEVGSPQNHRNGLLQGDGLKLTSNNEKGRIVVTGFEKYTGSSVPTKVQKEQTIDESWADIANYVKWDGNGVLDESNYRTLLEKWRRIDDGTTKYRIFIKLEFVTGYADPGGTPTVVFVAKWWSDAPNVYFPTTTKLMFAALSNMDSVDLRGIKFARTTDTSWMFETSKINALRMESDTGNVTDMSRMFRNLRTNSSSQTIIQLPDVAAFDTSSVTDMHSMFCMTSVASVNMSNWDTSKVTNMSQMFRSSKLVGAFDISMLDLSKVTDMSYMFYDAQTVTSVKLPSDISSVTTMEQMFYYCRSITLIDLGGGDASSLHDITNIFRNCTALETLIFPDDMSSVTNMLGICQNLSGLKYVTLPSDMSKVTTLNLAFQNCDSLETIDMSYVDMSGMVVLSEAFESCNSLKSVQMPTDPNALSNVVMFSSMFAFCTSLETFELSGRNLSGLRNYHYNYDAGFSAMFNGCSNLVSVDFSGSYAPNTSNVDSMFVNCKKLETADFTNFIVGGGPECELGLATYYMFLNCEKLTSVDLSGFMTPTVENVANVADMFNGCKALQTVYASAEWIDSNGGNTCFTTNTGGTPSVFMMFKNCNSLPHPNSYQGTNGADSQNYAKFIENGGNFTQKAAPAIPTFPATGNGGNSVPGTTVQTNALPAGGAQIMGDDDEGGEGGDNGSEPSGLISQVSDANKWVHVDGDTWSYTFDVYDVDATYYLWEGAMAGWQTDAGIDNPITIVYKAGGTIESATSANDPYERLVDLGDGKYGVKITNTKDTPETVSLTVKKVVTNDGDKDAEFTIHVALSDTTLNGTYGDVDLTNGEADIHLKNGNQVTLLDLPVGVSYTITEPDPQGHTVTIENATGTLENAGDAALVTVTNDKVNPPKSALDVKKVLTTDGEAELTQEDLDRKFFVTVTLYTDSALTQVATDVTGLYGNVYFENGVSTTLMIQGGETVSITDLPTVASGTGANVTYTDLYYKVEETIVEGFEVSYANQSGQTTRMTDDENATVVLATVTNTKINPPKGGFKVTKVLEGAAAGDTTAFTFNVVFADLTPNTTYTYTIGSTEYTFTSLANRTAYVQFTLTNGQTATFTELPEGATHTVTEASSDFIASYTVVSNKDVASANGSNTVPYIALATSTETVEDDEDATITFTNTPAVVTKNGFKTWNDSGNDSGIRPVSITIYLMEGTAQIGSVTVTAADNWEWSFENLPKFDHNGNEIEYTFEEDIVYGYDTEYVEHENGDIEVINTHVPAYIDLPIRKVWKDNDNSGNTRPGAIVINLYADGTLTETVQVTGDTTGDWEYTFTHLRKYRVGTTEQISTNEIEYTVTENAVSGYIGVVEPYTEVVGGNVVKGFKVTNTLVINIEGEKIWYDGENADNTRPDSITVHLYADGVDTGRYVVATAPDWSWSFSNLNKYKEVDGEFVEIVYSIVEDEVSNYITTYPAEGYDVINTETTESTVRKVWDDENNKDQIRPVSIQVQLYADGEALGDPVTLNEAGNWTYTESDLPKYDSATGALIAYTWAETSTPNQYELISTVLDGKVTTITNKHTPEYVDVSGIKEWADADDEDGIRPSSVTVILKADGAQKDTTTATAAGNWAWSFTDLPKYNYTFNATTGAVTKTEIEYTVDESAVPEYETTIEKLEDGTYKITNTHVPEYVDVEGIKEWADADDEDGIRPSKVTVILKADGTQKDTTTATVDTNWAWSFEHLPKYKYTVNNDGSVTKTEIEYTVDESAVPEYETTIEKLEDGTYKITNTHVPEYVDVEGIKEWADAEDEDGIRPSKVTVILKADGTQKDTTTATVDTNWAWSFENLPKYKYTVNNDGSVTKTEIEYTVDESAVPEYETTIEKLADGTYKITNTHTPEYVEASVKKVWNDNNDQDDIRPATLVVKLVADGEDVPGKTVTLTEADGWAEKGFDGLPKWKYTVNEDGSVTKTEIVYSWAEVSVPEGYTFAGATANGTLTTLTNTHIPGKVPVSVSKIWNDNNNADNIRPLKIVVRLYADGVAVEGSDFELNAGNEWKHTWEDLDEKNNGVVIKYTVQEVEVPAWYAAEVSGSAQEGYVITNTHTPEYVDVNGIKKWADADDEDEIRPKSVTVILLADGTEKDTTTATVDTNWAWKFTKLPKYVYTVNADGSVKKTEIKYTVDESAVPEYETTIEKLEDGTYVITNTHTPEYVNVEGIKKWADANDEDGIRPKSVTVILLADGTQKDTTTATVDTNWAWSFTKLPKYKFEVKDDGTVIKTEIKYTVDESAVPEYETTIEKLEDGTYVITNTHTPEYVNVEGIKKWADANDEDGIRPKSVTVILLADGTQKDTTTATVDTNWAWSFTKLPKYKFEVKDDGTVIKTEIKYTVDESAVPEYETTIEFVNGQFVITNTHTPEYVNVEGIKKWADADDEDGIRPKSVTVILLADGTQKDTTTATVDTNWAWSFTKLPKYKFEVKDDGTVIKTEIKYTVDESAVPEYETTIEFVNGQYVITNTHTPEYVNVEGIKKWADADDEDGIRPKSVTVILLADGKEKDTTTATARSNWAWSFNNLPKYKFEVKDDGTVIKTEIKYTVDESAVPEYETTIEFVNGQFVITNTHTPEYVNVEGIKKWADADDEDGIRPKSVTVILLADGVKSQTTTATVDTNWAWSFTKLPKYKFEVKDDGTVIKTEIKYTVDESAVPEYTTTIKFENGQFVITNTHTPEYVDASVVKVWDDANDQDDIRPATLVVKLVADGVDVPGKTVTLTEADGWAKKTIEKLPKYKFTVNTDGSVTKTEITYSWAEVSIPEGYSFAGATAEGTLTTLKNTHKPGKVSVSVKKVWNDANNADNIRPLKIVVRLYADGVAVAGSDFELNAGNNWSHTWEDLDEKKDGVKIEYTVDEVSVPDWYAKEIAGSAQEGYVITNTHEPEYVNVEGIKVWADADDEDKIRPDEVTVILYADKVEAATTTATKLGNWAWSFTRLAKYVYTVNDDGSVKKTEIKYDVDESAVPEYETTIEKLEDGSYVITNTHTPEKVNIEGIKVWADADDEDKIRPSKVTVILKAGNTEIDTTEATVDTNWAWSFTDLPKYEFTVNADGSVTKTEIVYNVDESAVPEYETTIEKLEDGTYVITNTHTPEKVNVEGIKVWADADDEDKIRPSKVTVILKAGNTEIDTTEATVDTNWAWSFTDLPKYEFTVNADGSVTKTEIVYDVDESAVPEYETTIEKLEDGTYVITNTHEPEYVDASVVKVWNDNNDQDDIRPATLVVKLLADGVDVPNMTVTLTEDDEWAKKTIKDLPKYKFTVNADGSVTKTEIVYTWAEVSVPEGYTFAGASKVGILTTLTNTHIPGKVTISVKKIWNDANDADKIRPLKIVVRLYADGVAVAGSDFELNKDNNWSHTWEDLDEKKDGVKIKYTVDEVSVPYWYAKEIAGSAQEGYVITNTHEPEYVNVEGIKVWADADDEDKIRPTKVTVILKAGNTEIDTTEATVDTNWAWSFTDLPKYEFTVNADGSVKKTEIVYDVDESAVPEYETTIEKLDDGTYVITNTHTPEKVNVEGIKVWADADDEDKIRPTKVTVILKAGNTEIDTTEATVDTNWAWSFTDLPKYKFTVNDDGSVTKTEIKYDVDESAVPEYETTIEKLDDGTYVITNTHTPEKVNVEGIKVWADADDEDKIRPTKVTVILKADDAEIDTAEATVDTNWAWSFANLPKYKFTVNDDGSVTKTEIVYDVDESAVPEYETTIEKLEDGTYVITNTHTPEKVNVEGIKVWADADDEDKIRPTKVTVILKADDAEIDTAEATVDTNWAWSFTNLPKYKFTVNADGSVTKTEIKYDVDESAVPEYETTIEKLEDGTYVITNTHTPEYVDASVVKVWDDANDQDGKRPATLVVELLADGEKLEPAVTVTLTAADDWAQQTIEKLPKYKFTKNDDGSITKTEIVYTWNEVEVPEGYELISNETEGVLTTITNKHVPELTEAGVKKIWDDNDNQDGIRPLELVVALMNGDVKVTEVTLNADNDWSAMVTDLDKFENGVEIEYTWVEIDIPEGYTLEGMTKEGVITSIINPHVPEKINIEGGKRWTGETCAEQTRPVSITVKLYADGVEIRSIEVTSINDWTFSFTDLDKYKDGKEIVYTLGEIEVPGYVTKIDDEHYIIVNEWIPPEPPQTGDFDMLGVLGVITVMMVGLVVLKKKRRIDEIA